MKIKLFILFPLLLASIGTAWGESKKSINEVKKPEGNGVLVLRLGEEEYESNPRIAFITSDGFVILKSNSKSLPSIQVLSPSFDVVKVGLSSQGHDFKEEPLIAQRGYVEGEYFTLDPDRRTDLGTAMKDFRWYQTVSLGNFFQNSSNGNSVQVSEPLTWKVTGQRIFSRWMWIFLTNFFVPSPIPSLPLKSFASSDGILDRGFHNTGVLVSAVAGAWAITSVSERMFPKLKLPQNRKWLDRIVGAGTVVGCGLILKALGHS